MSILSQPQHIGDWLKFENDCRDMVTVLVSADLPSGQVLGVESVFSKYAPYDNSNPSAASAILIELQTAKAAMSVTSITNATTTATVVFPTPHGLIVGDIIKVSGATVDTDLNCNAAVATVPSATSITFTSANVTDATYTETTLRITKLNHKAAVIVRGPAKINSAGLNWGVSDGTGIIAGLADLKALNIIALEAA